MIESRRYRAASMPEALQQIKSDLGPDAIIIHSQPVRVGGMFGLFAQRAVEVRAAAMTTQDDLDAGAIQPRQPRQWKPSQLTGDETIALTKESPEPQRPATPLRKVQLEQFSQRLGEASTLLADAYRCLQDEGVEDRLVQEIMLQTKAGLTFESLGRPDSLHVALRSAMLSRLPRRRIRQDTPPHLICLQGPTGVGKTTTAAKLIGLFQSERLRPALLTIDVLRVGAIAQIEAYARIMGVPFAVAYDPRELAAKVESWSDYDVIVVDTPGMGEAQPERLADLRCHLQALPQSSNFLVLSATAKTEDMLATVETFKGMASIDAIVTTKLDESRHLGGLYGVLHATQTPLAFSSSGQQVPEDLTVGGTEELIARILASWREPSLARGVGTCLP
ncbi:MAG: hypothetical protein EPO21_15615 [Chloroflexota bacterium]|nr:MAG: hypothetical protein EPO21_15615 [Chloroflexota bacterium]